MNVFQEFPWVQLLFFQNLEPESKTTSVQWHSNTKKLLKHGRESILKFELILKYLKTLQDILFGTKMENLSQNLQQKIFFRLNDKNVITQDSFNFV